MNLFGVLDISGSALKAERIRAEVVAANMANAETTRTDKGIPYQRQHVVFEPGMDGAEHPVGSFASNLLQPVGLLSLPGEPGLDGGSGSWGLGLGAFTGKTVDETVQGVQVAGVFEDRTQALRRYDPGHPDADKDGYVNYPDINPLTEMVDLMGATRAYGLNSSAVQATKTMIAASLDILK